MATKEAGRLVADVDSLTLRTSVCGGGMERDRNRRLLIFIYLYLLTLILPSIGRKCNERKIYTDSNGTIEDGPDKYSAFSRCEWLIDAGSSKNSIVLEFKSMDTECSYDFMFIHDGNSYESPLLASLSGDTLPKTIIAKSGYMLIFLFSDRNYERQGFKANYMIQSCPFNCHGNGVCSDHKCYCDGYHIGESCEYKICPSDCNNNGECFTKGDNPGCLCNGGHLGVACDLDVLGNTGSQKWYNLLEGSPNFSARTSHSGVFIKNTQCLYVFGGYNLNKALDDLVRYCLEGNSWEVMTKKEPWPSPRRDHAMVDIDTGFYIVGGILENGSHTNELWFYNLSSDSWSLKALNSTLTLPCLKDHTFTVVDEWIYLVGGKSQEGIYSPNIYRINASQAEEWEDVHVTGGRKPERFLSGHSALYHPESKSILIYGGYTTRRARYSHLSNKLFAFNTVNSFWSQIHFHYIDKTYMPKQRAHHSAVIMGNYMVIYGGNVHIHNHIETCYDPGIYLYHLGCHQWIQHPLVHGNSTGLPPKGRFGHVAVGVQGNLMFVVGGYSGYVHDNLLAYKFPSVVAPPESEVLQDKDYCLEYNDKQKCVDDRECAFCNTRRDISRPGCIHRTRTEMCSSPIDYITTPCQGICSLLSTCETCLTQGQGVYLNPVSPMRRYYQEECLWCVKNSTCQRKAVPEGTCQSPDGTKSGIQGWWEGLSSKWTDIDQCSLYDIPGGVRAVKYFDPVDMSYPDEVEILGEIETNVYSDVLHERKIQEGGFWITHVKGYIYPLNAQPVEGTDRLEVFLFVHKSSASLNISKNSSVIAQEQVAVLGNSDTIKKKEAFRSDNTPIFSNVARGYKYFFKLETIKPISEESNSSVAIKWNSGGKEWTSRNNFYTISKEFLEQYHTDNCTQYVTCLACLTDASCAWCPVDSACYIKGHNSSKCSGSEPVEYLVTAPSYCSVCGDYVDCQSCNKDNLCKWVTGNEKCVRRGRANPQRVTECSVPCHMRKNCTSCIIDKNEKNVCFWCENMGVCLPFAHYITLYIHGECREWVDDEGKDTYTCPECSHHDTYTTCLTQYGCGWCGNEDNPYIGKCVTGDFKGPFGDKNCSILISQYQNESSLASSLWAYHIKPKVNECALGKHQCNENATCIDTDDSYECKCKRGYFGDGKYCFQTCYYDCGTYGECSNSPDFTCICKLGWTGNDCNTSCGCNLQSTCNTGVGICDKCQNNAEGKYCEMCKPGYYGIPASIRGCQKCNCNGHGDLELGLCNNATSECYCIHNTNGTNCEKCVDGYYGNPRNGSKCFRRCENKVVLNQTIGSLGYYEGDGHCLWIISPYSEDVLPKLELEDRSTISLQFDAIDTRCGKEYVYIYDGIPEFIDGSKDASGYLLGAFCGNSIEDKIMAKSGIMIVYAQPESGMKFNASYIINDCSEDCLMKQNQFCHINQCQCDPGLKGDNCDSIACPAHCTVGKFKESCICHSGYGAGNYTAEIFPWSIPTMLQTTGFPGELNRYGHTLVNCGGNDILYLFGGFSLKHGPMNDLWMYNISHQRWSKITAVTDDQPSGRYYHSAVCLPYLKMLYVFGGFVKSNNGQQMYQATNEFWRFSIGPRKWSNQSIPSWLQPVGGHTLTQITDTKMIVIGGFSTENYFSDQMYEYDANSIHETGQAGESSTYGWKKFGRKNVDGTIPIGFYGHSAVYHSTTNSLFIYGGMIYRQGVFFVSSDLFAVDLDYDKHWYILQSEERSQREPRYLHTAVGVGDYMVVIGGQTSSHGNKSDGILLYRYLCNFWHKFKIQGISLVKSFTGLVGTRAVGINGSIYIMGGIDNTAHNQVIRLDLPEDICSLISELDQCLNASGCSACIVSLPGGKNRTYCYSNNQPAPSSCEEEEAILVTGEQCSLQWHLERMCKKYQTCSSCLAVFPHFKHARQTCQWCTKCNGIHLKRRCFHCTGLCTGTSCTDCINVPTNGITSTASGCTENRACQAADCEKCTNMISCIWTREIESLNAYRRNIYIAQGNWNCFSDSYKESNVSSSHMCPDKCYMHKNCTSCLQSHGGEGGSMECKWSSALQECMSPAYVLFRCSGGECGLILEGHSSKCPVPCWNHTWCSNCLQAAGCGWCAFGGFHGRGICMDGGINTPTGGFCRQDNISLIDGRLTDEQEKYRWRANPEWHYLQCPPENECKNNHHTCDSETQDCIDSLEGYYCTCKKGYVLDYEYMTGTCKPVCHNECEHGYCAKPDFCVCDFGWVGAKCDVECQCNGHSNCKSVELKDECLECHNNTQGDHCEWCKPLFVGDPKKNIKCISCLQHCNNHTRICVDQRYNTSAIFPPSIEILNNDHVVQRGPVPGNAVCIDCKDNTEGTRCESCVGGHFRVKSEGHNLTHPCLKCQCHGHSVTCNVDTGEGCRCGNNTETRCTKQSDDAGGEKCWQKQCSVCKEYFLGTPTNKHQCYRQMSVDKDYCLDPETQNQCNQNPSPLGLHRTVFFVVQPKYLNVDIRITIDITQGGADVYFSSNDKTFVVNVNDYTGVHEVELDPIFDISEHIPPHHHLRKRSIYNTTSGERHEVLPIRADGFHTYYTLLETSNILIVRDVQRRLVITLPLESHDLRKSKFFIILRGKGDMDSTKTYGTLYFRQDQPHIDLFVFFSVFFSSFFLFLSMCVLLWKIKQAFDAQRSRQLRAKEMLHMASRPFAKVLVLIEPDYMPYSSTPLPRRTKVQKLPSRNLPPLPLPQDNNTHIPFYFPIKSCPFDITPIAMEPTDDGIASVRTAILQLPGGPSAPTKLCLGSALTTSCRVNLSGTKATVRRRPSSTAC